MKKRIKNWIVIFVMGMILSGCLGPARLQLAPADPTPRIAVISAFPAETSVLLRQAKASDKVLVNGRSVTVGQLAGRDVIILASGESMVNAAMMTQAVLDRFKIKAIVVSGIAGGVNPDLNIGDVTVPAQWGEYQEQTFARQGADGSYQASSPFSGFGMMFPQMVNVTRANGRPDAAEPVFWFKADAGMLSTAQKAASTLTLKRCPLLGLCLPADPKIVVGGNGVSGPTFVDNAEYRQWVWETFEADALDMETAAIAHVAYVNEIPLIAFRSLSDLAGGGAGSNELVAFQQTAADNAAAVVVAFLQAWEPD